MSQKVISTLTAGIALIAEMRPHYSLKLLKLTSNICILTIPISYAKQKIDKDETVIAAALALITEMNKLRFEPFRRLGVKRLEK